MKAAQVRGGRFQRFAIGATVVALTGIGVTPAEAAYRPADVHRRGTCGLPLTAGLHTVDVVQQGVHRPLQLWVPSGYRDREVPLMFWLHGSGTTGAQAMATLDSAGQPLFPADADEHDYAVATPTGAIPFNPAPGISGFAWNIPGVPLVGSTTYPPPGALDDVEYIGRAIDAIASTMCIDKRRIYAAGASGGGRMASQLACDLADRIAAIAPVMGVRFPHASDTAGRTTECVPSRRVPVLAIHGRLDPVNVFADDDPRIVPGSSWTYGVPEALRRWVLANGCKADNPRRETVSAHVQLITYKGCHAGADVSLYDIADGGHTVPGTPVVPPLVAIVGPTNQELNTPDAIWDFVSHFHLPNT
jgi:polyhydroxybutyrate depolymerase